MQSVNRDEGSHTDSYYIFNLFDAHVTLHHDKFLIIKPTRCTNFSKLYFGMKLYVFQTVPLSIIRSFLLYTQQWYMS